MNDLDGGGFQGSLLVKGESMTVDPKTSPRFFDEVEKPSLIGISADEFQKQYGNYVWLLVRTADQVPVAASSDPDRKALGQAFKERHSLENLTGYMYQHGPEGLRKAAHVILLSEREAIDRTSPESPAR